MRDVDAAILAIDFGPVTLLDGYVPTENDGTVVNYPVPYGVYYASLGDDHSPRLTGRNTRRAKFFSITYVGETREQAMFAGEHFRDALVDRRLTVADRRSWLIGLEESQRIRRDDDAIRPDGSPLFYGVDNYALSVTTRPAQPENTTP